LQRARVSACRSGAGMQSVGKCGCAQCSADSDGEGEGGTGLGGGKAAAGRLHAHHRRVLDRVLDSFVRIASRIQERKPRRKRRQPPLHRRDGKRGSTVRLHRRQELGRVALAEQALLLHPTRNPIIRIMTRASSMPPHREAGPCAPANTSTNAPDSLPQLFHARPRKYHHSTAHHAETNRQAQGPMDHDWQCATAAVWLRR
jgi:hypothetical protein